MPVSKKVEKNQSDSSLGSFIRQRRVESGLTLEEVATYLEISVEAVVRYEEDKKQIPLNHLYALSNCLNISAELILRRIPVR
jgi:transcriptional regulator with XRE-family HTH domain